MAYHGCDFESLISSEDDSECDHDTPIGRENLERLLYEDDDSESMLFLSTELSSTINLVDQYDIKIEHNILMSQQNNSKVPPEIFAFREEVVNGAAIISKMLMSVEQDSDPEEDDCTSLVGQTNILLDDSEYEDFDELIENTWGKANPLAEFERAGRREQRHLLDKFALHLNRSDPLGLLATGPHPTINQEGKFSYFALGTIASVGGKTKFVTAVHIHSSCISVGDNGGLITVYDHDQSPRLILYNSDISSSVTVIDITSDESFLVCGYENGVIALWNIFADARGNPLLVFIDDLHILPLKFLRILQAPKLQATKRKRFKSDSTVNFLSSDSSGATNRIKIKKTMFTKYTYESECLLKGSSASSKGSISSDIIISLSVLPSTLSPVNNSMEATDWLDMEIMSFSTSTKTFIVQLRPVVKMLHRWQIAPSSRCEIERENDSDGESDKSVGSSTNDSTTCSASRSLNNLSKLAIYPRISLDWSWTCIPGAGLKAPVLVPLLLRTHGSMIQVLSLSLCSSLPQSEGRPGSKCGDSSKDSSSISYAVVGHRVEEEQFISAKWIDGGSSRIVAITETHLLIFSFPDFVILDKSTLASDMAAIIQPESLYSPESRTRDGQSTELRSHPIPYDIVFESCGGNYYVFPLQRVPSLTTSFIAQSVIPFYRVSYSSEYHVGYGSSVLLLVQQGKWLDALSLCVQCATRRCEKECDADDAGFETGRSQLSSKESSFIISLVRDYADTAVCRHSVFTGGCLWSSGLTACGSSNRAIRPRLLGNQSCSHYQLAAQVCIQYCVTLDIIDLLFTEIFEMFKMSGQESIYLRTIANYVISYQVSVEQSMALQCLPIHILCSMERMADCDSVSLLPLSSFTFNLLERCVLSLDMVRQAEKYGLTDIPDMMLRHELVSGYLYSFSCGGVYCVDAFKAAFAYYHLIYGSTDDCSRISYDNITDRDSASCTTTVCCPLLSSSPTDTDQMEGKSVGYLLLLFLLHNLSGLTFPTGQPSKAPVPVQRRLDLLEEVVSTSIIATTAPGLNVVPTTCTAGSSHRQYLRVLAAVDSEALLYCITVGMRHIPCTEPYIPKVRSLHINIFQFVSECDTSYQSGSCQVGERSMREAYFRYCVHDLMSAAFVLPEEMVLAFFEFLGSQIHDMHRNSQDVGSGPVSEEAVGSERENLRAKELVCRLACMEAHISALLYSNDDAQKSLNRFTVISQCLRTLHCWRAALLFDAEYCRARGSCYLLNRDNLTLAMSHLTGPNTPYTPSGIEVFRYLNSLIRILSNDRSDSNDGYELDMPPELDGSPLVQSSFVSISPHTLREFRDIFSGYIVTLALISLEETKRLVTAIYSDDIPSLIAATEKSHSVQLELLTTLLDKAMHRNGPTENLSCPAVSHSTFLKYVSLLLWENPGELQPFLARCRISGYQFPLGECLLLLTAPATPLYGNLAPLSMITEGRGDISWRSLDAVAFLKELSSDLEGSLAAILLFISCAVFEERSEGTGNSGPIRSEPKHGSAVIHGVQYLIMLCTHQGVRDKSILSKSPSDESIWYTALDSLLSIPGTQRS